MFAWIEEILSKIRKMNGSIEEYKKDTVIQSLPSFAYVQRAKKLIEANCFMEAECILNSALNLPQEDALVYKYLGLVAEKTNRKTDAIIAYKKSAKIDPNDKDIWRILGFLLISTGLFDEAEKAFENASKITPLNSDVFTGWGMSLTKQKKYTEAHEKFTQASQLNKYNFMAMLLSAIVEIKLERYDEAENKLKFLASVSPNESNTYEYANLKYLKGDYSSAVHYAKKALTFNANMLPAYILLGEVYYKLKDKKNSLAAYNQAFQRKLVNDDLYTEWGIALQVFGEYDEAKVKFEKVLEKSPDSKTGKTGFALCSAYSGELESACKIVEELSPEDKKSYLGKKARGFIAFRKGEYNNAIEIFKEILQSNAYDSLLVFYIAKSNEVLGNDILAKEYYEKSVKENPEYIEAYKSYANYLISKKEYADCQRKLRRALKIDENNIDILNLYFYVSYILVKDNVCDYNVKETIAIADKIISINGDNFRYWKEKDELSEMLNK